MQDRAGSGNAQRPPSGAMPSRKRRSSGLGDLRQEWEAEEQGREEGVAATTGEDELHVTSPLSVELTGEAQHGVQWQCSKFL